MWPPITLCPYSAGEETEAVEAKWLLSGHPCWAEAGLQSPGLCLLVLGPYCWPVRVPIHPSTHPYIHLSI